MSSNPYESRRYLDEYLLFHYGTEQQRCPFPGAPAGALHFHERILRECMLPVPRNRPTRALDIGCAVGRFTYELASVVTEATGIDNSRAFVRAARRMARDKQMKICVQEEGAQTTQQLVRLPARLRRGKVQFAVGDAMKLPEDRYDVVAAINLLCRLPNPRKFLDSLADRVLPGGQLLLISPYSWQEEYTPKRLWLSSKQIPRILAMDFLLRRRQNLSFLIREHRRKYQWVIAEALTFQRRQSL